ncbi:SDR family oxidoreductase [Streptomyces sp. NBC_01549]|nr:SDR family oxidoreductase [Streptomyces sp. NBC_01549]
MRSVESIEREIALNLTSPLVATRIAIPLLKASRDARVVTTVSLGGIFPLGETPIYTASKFGLRGAMLAIGLDLRSKGILAGAVLPSATDTGCCARRPWTAGTPCSSRTRRSSPRTSSRCQGRPCHATWVQPSQELAGHHDRRFGRTARSGPVLRTNQPSRGAVTPVSAGQDKDTPWTTRRRRMPPRAWS